jgi:cbb3-type cytochrome oxidase subunit 3
MDPNLSPPDPNLSSPYLVHLAYIACGVLIIFYAWDRFSTPASNRSSTRQALYLWGCAGYIVSALGVFAILSVLLQVGAWRTMLLGPIDKLSLPAPFIATLAMTTLLSSIPVLKQIDGWILSTFLDWASIPAEVKRRAATMTQQSFHVTEEDVTALRNAYDDGSYGDTLAGHLCARSNDGKESQYRLTRILKLYDQIKKLSSESRYARFFSEAADEFAAVERKAIVFLRRSDFSLTLAERLRAMDAKDARATCEELMQERRNTFAEDCRDLFGDLASLLARAVLRSEPSEKDIVDRLRAIGFSASVPMNVPRFPIDSLTVLALLMFFYLVIVLRLPIVPDQPDGGLFTACKITIARLTSIGLTVWLMQNYCIFRRLPGRPPRYFGYVLCGLIAAAGSAGVLLIFHLGDIGGVLRVDLPVIVLSGVLCAALSLCCDDWAGDRVAPIWLRFVEAVGCGLVMAAGIIFMYVATDLLPKGMSPWVLVLPPMLGVFIGGWVPHIYRSAHRAAMSERGNNCELPAGQAIAQARVTSLPTLADAA